MLLGSYEILLNGRRDDHCRIQSDIIIEDGQSRIEILHDGHVKIYAEDREKLRKLELVVRVSIGRTTGWSGFSLRLLDLVDLQTNQKVFYLEQTGRPIHYNLFQTTLEQTAKGLVRVDSQTILLLACSTEGPMDNEPSVLVALTALELKLNEIVPKRRLNVASKLAVLEHLDLMSQEDINSLKDLFSLRNKLAHGKWTKKDIGAVVQKLLGTESNAFPDCSDSSRMALWVRYRVLEKIADKVVFLSSLKDDWRRTNKRLERTVGQSKGRI